MIKKLNLPKPFFYLLVIFPFFLLLNFLGAFKPLKRVLEKAVVIPTKEEFFRWQRFFKKDLGGCGLKNEREVSELEAKILSLQEENRAQKRMLSVPLPKNWQFLTAKVISSEGETININTGKETGVKEGMIAILGESYLGKVSKVSERISEVRLVSSPEERLVVKIASETEGNISGRGLLIGQGQGKMMIEQILPSEDIKKGDKILVNLEGGDLLAGKIEEITESEGEPFKTAQVKRLFNPEELNTIFLIRGRL